MRYSSGATGTIGVSAFDAASEAEPELEGGAAPCATGAGIDLPCAALASGSDAVVSGAAACVGRGRGVGARGTAAVCRTGGAATVGGGVPGVR